jgi:sugar phosphate isomerase/epimerase
MMKRRRFVQLTGVSMSAALASGLWSCSPLPPGRAWGVQLFSIPKMVTDDFAGTMKTLGYLGYREVEFFGPYPFSDPVTIDRWVGLSAQLGITRNAFYGYEVSEVKKLLDDNQLSAPSVHMDILTMRSNMPEAMKQLSTLGVRYCAIPALMEEPRETADDYKRFADEFNSFGKQMKDFGISFVYHNHGYEHAEKEGQIPMDILISNTDPDVVKFELDIFWMQAAGASPVEYLKKYPGRFRLMHVKDAAGPVRFAGDGSTPDQWMEVFPMMADPGTGVFDIKGIIEAGVQSGVEHFFLERDLTPTPETTLKNSIHYFKSLTI